MGILSLALAVASDALAGPLYGGYNGESEAWIEFPIYEENRIGYSIKILIGADVDLNWWAKFSISGLALIPYNLTRIAFSYDVGDVVSTSVNSLLPWPLQIGADSDERIWAATNFLVGIIGIDNNRTVWQETGLAGVWARGLDSLDNQWQWLKVLSVLVGVGDGSGVEGEGLLGQEESIPLKEDLVSSWKACKTCKEAYGPKISSLLVEKLTHDEIMVNLNRRAVRWNHQMTFLCLSDFLCNDGSGWLQTPLSSSGEVRGDNRLVEYVEEKILTAEIKDEIVALMDKFAQAIQPQLKDLEK